MSAEHYEFASFYINNLVDQISDEASICYNGSATIIMRSEQEVNQRYKIAAFLHTVADAVYELELHDSGDIDDFERVLNAFKSCRFEE